IEDTCIEDAPSKIGPSTGEKREDQRIILATSVPVPPRKRSDSLTNIGVRSRPRNIQGLESIPSSIPALLDEKSTYAARSTPSARTASSTASRRLNLPPIEPEKRPIIASYLAREALEDVEQNPALAQSKIEAAKELMPERYDLLHASARIYLRLGDHLQARRELHAADALYRRLRQDHQDNAESEVDSDFLIAQARVYSSLRDNEQALLRLDEILAADPVHLDARIEKALVLLNRIDRKTGLELLLGALPQLKRGSKKFYDLRTRAAEETEKLAFAAREEPLDRLRAFSIMDYAKELSHLLPAFAQCVLHLRSVCSNAHFQSMPVILRPRKSVASPNDANEAVVDWAFTYMCIVKESDILEYFRELNNEEMHRYSKSLIDTVNMHPTEMYVLFYSGEASQIPSRISPALKGHCNARLKKQLMENNICVYDLQELNGFVDAYVNMQAQYGQNVPADAVKANLEEHVFALCDAMISSKSPF
ncbi:hypothetical protein HZB03_01255, partial [Candidatus Woesearchaeota archaeon]|nr:hypothetical protein [Candidatus Woesearchaeota archaeon]